MRYSEEVILTLDEWVDIQEKLVRLSVLEVWAKRQAEHDAEYLRWSLSPERLTDALRLAQAIKS